MLGYTRDGMKNIDINTHCGIEIDGMNKLD